MLDDMPVACPRDAEEAGRGPPRGTGGAPPPPWWEALVLALSALPLLWPALLNGYPLVFSDTGTYLGQAIEHYLGWDRPAYYSIFLMSLHWTVTTWPAILAQAALTVWVLRLGLRGFAPALPGWCLLPLTVALSFLTALPWFVSQLMPDLFTGTLAITLVLLIIVPERLGRRERWLLSGGAAAMIAFHQSNLPLSLGLLVALLLLRRPLGGAAPLTAGDVLRLVAPPLVAALALVSANYVVHRRAALSPYGNVFVLARLLYDGPALDTLHAECPAAGWRLCDLADHLPQSSDHFLWMHDGPLAQLGGAKAFSGEAGQIIAATLRREPLEVAATALRNTARQFVTFASGDGLEAWPETVSVVIERHFPAFEVRRYEESLQTQGRLAVPSLLACLHLATFWLGLGATVAGLGIALRRGDPAAALLAAILLTLVGNAAITGALSGPHARYQSRVVWMTAFGAVVTGGALLRRDRPAARQGEALLVLPPLLTGLAAPPKGTAGGAEI